MVFSIVAKSAFSTLSVLDRQSRKDFGKAIAVIHSVYIVLSSPEAMQTYRAIGRLIQIAWMCLVLVFLVVQKMVDRQVESCLPQSEPVADPIATELENSGDVDRLIQVPEEVQAEGDRNAEVDRVEILDDEPPHDGQVAVFSIADVEAMNKNQLRKACQEWGVRWSHARKDGKHLTCDEMRRILLSVC